MPPRPSLSPGDVSRFLFLLGSDLPLVHKVGWRLVLVDRVPGVDEVICSFPKGTLDTSAVGPLGGFNKLRVAGACQREEDAP